MAGEVVSEQFAFYFSFVLMEKVVILFPCPGASVFDGYFQQIRIND
jgi:hypothetical protein